MRVSQIKEHAGLAGIDTIRLAHLEQKFGIDIPGTGSAKEDLITALEREIDQLDPANKSRVLNYFVEIVVNHPSYPTESFDLDSHLERLGWQIEDGKLIPINIFDISEFSDLPDVSKPDLLNAATRLRNGDLTGALGAACAAVDSATNAIYSDYRLGRPWDDNFQMRCNRALQVKNIFKQLSDELSDMGWNENDVKMFSRNLKGALNQGAYVMQTLRSRMSDVHGSKPVLNPLIYDSLKWAALILRMLK